MKIPVFSLEPAFLNAHLSRVERRLLGLPLQAEVSLLSRVLSVWEKCQSVRSALITAMSLVSPVIVRTWRALPSRPQVNVTGPDRLVWSSRLAWLGQLLRQRLNVPRPFLVRATRRVAQAMALVAVLVIASVALPWAYYTFAPVDIVAVESLDPGSILGGAYTSASARTVNVPPKDETLPKGSWISIPAIGVRTELRPTAVPEDALRLGVWLDPDHGQPGDITQPMIVVAHRYGYKVWWQDDYWKYNSFYFLPKTQPGDLIEIIHDQRKWTYEIYAGEEGQEITDYSADMILYTCKYLNSPVRHFRYARLVDTTQNTQK